jgi:hypothetical protein
VVEYSAFIPPEDVDEVVEQIRAILAYHGQAEGVLIKVFVRDKQQREEVV